MIFTGGSYLRSEDLLKRQKSTKRNCAFFDVDGTLLAGYIIGSFPSYLADKGFIDAKYPNEIDRIISDYGKGNIEYREAAETVAIQYALALKGKKEIKIKCWARDFMEDYIPEHTFSYSKQLVLSVRNLVDITIAVSGSPQETIKEIQMLGFDDLYGSLFEIEDGIYTGKVVANLILGEEKARIVQNISEDLNIDLSRSIGFGDTDQDEFVLNLVGLPIAVNPNKKLRQICELRNWLVLEKEDLLDLTIINKLIEMNF
jgi:putative phosphoserine phosphatase/1-acylglycerol-3-phosphate O-acyltransferase